MVAEGVVVYGVVVYGVFVEAPAMWLAKAAIDMAPAGVAMNDMACAKALGSVGCWLMF